MPSGKVSVEPSRVVTTVPSFHGSIVPSCVTVAVKPPASTPCAAHGSGAVAAAWALEPEPLPDPAVFDPPRTTRITATPAPAIATRASTRISALLPLRGFAATTGAGAGVGTCDGGGGVPDGSGAA